MVITQQQFNTAMTEINASFMAMHKKIEKLEVEAKAAVKPTTTKDKK
tara:strand:+ start:265 stop:405 length:141 start_codon:yes stop_codon:yes gene_type:complete